MSGGKHIKQAIIASLCEHPDAEKYRLRAFSGGSLERIAMGNPETLTKDDFLTPDDDGTFILDSAGAWKNFDKIVKIVHSGGERFVFQDFMKVLNEKSGRTVLESAQAYAGLSSIFTFDVWQGHFGEMERLWHKVPKPQRDKIFGNNGLISADMKRQFFAADGQEMPEDRLAKAGLSLPDIRKAFETGKSFDELLDRLKQAGDRLRKEYILMTDSDGDTVFNIRPEPWHRYSALVKILQENGERLDVADYIRQVSCTKNILSRAAEHNALDKVFTAKHWQDRLPDMLTLWSFVLPAWKTGTMTPRDFDAAYAAAESATYMPRFQALSVTGKADLIKPLNNSATEKPVLPLGLKDVWENIGTVRAALKKSGEKLTLVDLRLTSGQRGDSCLISAVKSGCFDKAVAIVKDSGDALALDDFLSKDFHGATLIDLLAERNQLASAFSPDIWSGRVAEMKTLWSHVGTSQRTQVDIQQAEVDARQALLKRAKTGGIILHKNRPGKAP